MLVGLPTTGLAAVDPYPSGCVSCHVLDKAKGVDERLSVALAAWTAGRIESGLLAKGKTAADRHHRGSLQKLDQHRLVSRVEVRHDDIRQSTVDRYVG